MKYTLTLLTLALSAVIPASADTDYYLVIPSITGATSAGCGVKKVLSNQTLYADGIGSFTFSATDALSATGVPSSNRLNLQNFTILKGFDDCSGSLVTSFLSGVLIPKVIIYAVKVSAPPANPVPTTQATPVYPYLGITLENVIISQYSITSNSDNPAEQIGLTFKEIGITAVKEGHVTFFGYNASTNTTSTDLGIDPLIQLSVSSQQ